MAQNLSERAGMITQDGDADTPHFAGLETEYTVVIILKAADAS